jgi:hypothetical protein
MKMKDLLTLEPSSNKDFDSLARNLFIEMGKWIVDLQNQIKEQDERIRALEKVNQ